VHLQDLLLAVLLTAATVAPGCADSPPTADPVEDGADAARDDVRVKDSDTSSGGDVRVEDADVSGGDAGADVLPDTPAPEDVRPDVAELPDLGEDAAPEDTPTPPEDVAVDVAADVPQDAPDGDGVHLGVEAWTSGALVRVPARAELLPLPGGGEGGPVLVSNNPEVFTGDGLLYGNARPSPGRGGQGYPLSGEFGVYLHHLNRGATPLTLSLVVTNPNNTAVMVEAWGSGYTQTETGGLGLGTSPDYRVSREWLLGAPTTVVPPTSVASFRPLRIWQKQVNVNAEVDGRFGLRSDLPVYVYVVATSTSDLNEAVQDALIDAPGDYRASGNPPPPFGREAGVYAHDTWASTFAVDVPEGPSHVAFMVNTATGAGLSQLQAFPALDHYDQSAAEAVGMYGNIYDFDVELVHAGAGAARRVRVTFSSLATGNASRWWDGVGLVDGQEVVVRHVPGSETTTLADLTLQPGARRRLRFSAMVPGLAAIPQALAIEVLP